MSIFNSRRNKGKSMGEVSPGGSEIYIYKDQKDHKFRAPAAYGVFAEEVNSHFEALFPGRETFVFHELVSDLVHIDVNIMKPASEDDFYVMFTTGMSDLPMKIPNNISDRDGLKYAELFMFLPSSWNPGDAGTIGSDIPYEDFWPIQVIKFLARFPHEYKTWLGAGHTIPNGANYEPILEDSEMSGMVLLGLDDKYSMMYAKSGQIVHLYMVMPITRAETEYKLEHGMVALEDKFSEHDLPMVIDMYRKSVV